MTKKIVLLLSVLGSVLFYLLFISKTIDICDLYCSRSTDYYHRVTLFFPLIFIFSLITYFSPERIFQTWWKFARIAIPVCFGLSLIINLELHHDPNGQWQDMFDIPMLIAIYGIFVFGSLWQIWKGFRQR